MFKHKMQKHDHNKLVLKQTTLSMMRGLTGGKQMNLPLPPIL